MRTFALPIALAFFASAASAQCFDSAYGTAIGGASLFGDVVLPIQPIGFAFPIGTANYSNVHICDKGYVWLSNSGVPAPGGADFTASNAELGSSSPRVCALWADIQTLSSNAGEIYIKSNASSCTITWINARCYSATSGLFNMQMVLYPTGAVKVLFGPGTTNNSTQPTWQVGVAGLSPGLGATMPGPSDLSAGGVSTSSTVFEEWLVANTFDMANNGVLYTPTGSGGYVFTPLGGPVNCATTAAYGTGCVQQIDSVYEEWTSGFDFNGGTVTWLRTAGGYTMLTAIPGTFVPPSGTAVNLAPGLLDGSQVVTLSAPMPVAGGTTNTLCVTTKGQIQVASTTGGIDYTPTVAELLNDTLTTFALWHDYNQTAAGSGLILYEEVAGTAYITWNGVQSFSSVLPSTFQFQFNIATGNVTLVIVTMGGFANPDPGILGYSVAGPSFNPGSTDMSAFAGALALSDSTLQGLALGANSPPYVGNSSFNLLTSAVPNLVPIGIQFFGSAVVNPGLDLTFLGMSGCFAYTNADLGSVTFPVSLPAGTGSVNLPIPNNPLLIGTVLSAQSVCFTNLTAFGLATSNGLQMTIGN